MKIEQISNTLVNVIEDNGSLYRISITQGDTESTIIEKYNSIKAAEAQREYEKLNPPPPSYQELRFREYLAQGITEKELIIALWENIIEGRSDASIALQAKREAVKAKYPKS